MRAYVDYTKTIACKQHARVFRAAKLGNIFRMALKCHSTQADRLFVQWCRHHRICFTTEAHLSRNANILCCGLPIHGTECAELDDAICRQNLCVEKLDRQRRQMDACDSFCGAKTTSI